MRIVALNHRFRVLMRWMLSLLVVGVSLAACLSEEVETSTRVPADGRALTDLRAISVGGGRACGLRSDGSVGCIGFGDDRVMSSPDGVTFSSISVGKTHTCGIDREATAHCWGSNRHNQSKPPQNERFISVAVGDTHTCGLREDRSIVCWGQEFSGVVPDLPRHLKYKSVSAGGEHTCAVRDNGTGDCWGVLHAGIGEPDLSRQYVQMAVGGKHVCALLSESSAETGNVVCWAANNWNQARPSAGTQLVEITAGSTFSCGLRPDQTAVCWGENRTGGYRTAEGERLPDRVSITAPEGMRFSMLDAGNFHACGLREDGTMLCWGYMAEM